MSLETKKDHIEQAGLGCSYFLRDALHGVDVSPQLLRQLPGWPAMLRVGEMADPDFFDKVREHHPNGYIIGVGAGVIFSMIEGFDGENQPKGIVIADVNPKVIAFAKVLIDELKASQSQEDFEKRFFHQSKEEYEEKFKAKIEEETNPGFHEQIEICQDLEQFRDTPSEVWNEQKYVLRPDMIPVPKLFVQNFTVLKRLTDTDNISVIYADISNPYLIQAVGSLPGFNNLASIIYLSNVADSSETPLPDFQNAVAPLDSSGKSVFVQAVRDGYDLRLEIVK